MGKGANQLETVLIAKGLGPVGPPGMPQFWQRQRLHILLNRHCGARGGETVFHVAKHTIIFPSIDGLADHGIETMRCESTR